jgi:hypothetical protein
MGDPDLGVFDDTIYNAVIPGRAEREPGIHTPDRGYGFRACAKGRIPE